MGYGVNVREKAKTALVKYKDCVKEETTRARMYQDHLGDNPYKELVMIVTTEVHHPAQQQQEVGLLHSDHPSIHSTIL